MKIDFDAVRQIFKLDTAHSSYLIALVDDEKLVGHLYYGQRLPDNGVDDLMRIDEAPFVPSVNNRDRVPIMDSFPFEYPAYGLGDYRETCLQVTDANGMTASGLVYRSHRIHTGKPALDGLPSTFASDDDAMTLELVCEDPVLKLEVALYYSVFRGIDAIARSVRLVNQGDQCLTLNKVLSASLELDERDFDLITLHGSWARERHIQRLPVGRGRQGVASTRGEPGHQEHPFLAIAEKGADQDHGDVYAMHFVYSGNFTAQVMRSQFDTVRAVMGIHPDGFAWQLEPGGVFTAPETILVYSSAGLGGMTRTLHDLYRGHLIRGPWRDRKRPILINNWEATYFDFDTDKLINIAREAARTGIEMLVMDDGWFGDRKDDNRALGDWTVNENKLRGGLRYLVEQVNALGLAFGIWFEPEMISPDSDLYRAHPDWVIQIPGRTATLCRHQYVLDLTRPEVRDHVFEQVSSILKSANIAYVKWDMNRPLSDIGSAGLPADRQGELMHRYVLAVYELQERLLREFPDLLLENCSGGGARFDPGMLYYSPQIWTSDDTDAIERLAIQEGTALIYPLSSMGAHVSDSPNHTVGRTTSFETRGYVALAGTFGYELDITKIPQADRDMIPDQVAMYHKYNDLIRRGDYYRIASWRENHRYDCWAVVAKDQREALVTFVQVLGGANEHSWRIRCKGLDPLYRYRVEGTDQIMSGAALMYAGLQIRGLRGDFIGRLIHLLAEPEV